MCVTPIKIPNPNYRNKVDLIRKTKDTESQFIFVPCGHCSECVSRKQSDLVQRVRCLSLDHYIFFCTLTYNNESLPVFETSTGYKIFYASYKDVRLMLQRIRKNKLLSRDFLYYFTSERGKTGHRPHFHGLFFFKKFDDDDTYTPVRLEYELKKVLLAEWRRNYGSTRNPIWKPLCTFRSKYVAGRKYSNFDCHYVVNHSTEKGFDDVAFYVSKYCIKVSSYESKLQKALKLNLSSDEYTEVWNLVRSRSFYSHKFGFSTDREIEYIQDCISKSCDSPDGLKYYHLSGSTSPLANIYKKRFLSADAAISSVQAKGGTLSVDDRTLSEKFNSIEKGSIIADKVLSRDISDLFDL